MNQQDGPKVRVAAARRILARNGCDSNVVGHVSMRADDQTSFWVTPWQYLDETLPEDVSRLTLDMERVEGSRDYSPAVKFHAEIYAARPDVNAIVHTHTRWVQAFTTSVREVGMYAGESCLLYNEQALDDGGPGDNKTVAEALGPDKHILLMRNHGSVTVGASLEDATVLTMVLERCAQLHLTAETIPGSREYVPEPAIIASYKRYVVPEMWNACFRRLRRSDPEVFGTDVTRRRQSTPLSSPRSSTPEKGPHER